MHVGDTVLGYTLVAEAAVPATGRWMVTDARLDGAPVWVRVPRDEESKLLVKLCWERLRHLEHPAVPRVVGWDEAQSALAVSAPSGVAVTNLIAGRQEPAFAMNPGTVLDFATQLGDVLVHAHERGRPHGHIEPGNIWLTPAGRLVVWGFGDGPSAESSVGWQSPERARGQRPSGDADQWALAALVAALITGRTPWTDDDPVEQAKTGSAAHLSGPVLDQWKPLGRVVERALASEGRDRFPSVHPVRQALRAMADRVRQPSSLADMGVELDSRMGVALPETRRLASFGADADGELPSIIEDAPATFNLSGASTAPEDVPETEVAEPAAAAEAASEEPAEADEAVPATPEAPADPAAEEAPAVPAATTLPIPEDEPVLAPNAPAPLLPPEPVDDEGAPTVVEDEERPTVVDISPASDQQSMEPEFDPDAVATVRPTLEPQLDAANEPPAIGDVAMASHVPLEVRESDDPVLRFAPYVVGLMVVMMFIYFLVG